jgi:hypothetical protein
MYQIIIFEGKNDVIVQQIQDPETKNLDARWGKTLDNAIRHHPAFSGHSPNKCNGC